MLVIVGERAHEFDELRAKLMDQYDPQSALECEMVERLTIILWRLRRVSSFEVAILDARHQHQRTILACQSLRARKRRRNPTKEEIDWETSVDLGLALMDGRYGDTLGKIGRYETTLMNQFMKTLQMLRLLQHDRAIEKHDTATLKIIPLPPAA